MRITDKKYDGQLDEMDSIVANVMCVLKTVGDHMEYLEVADTGERIVLDTQKLHIAIEELERAREIAFNVEFSEYKEK